MNIEGAIRRIAEVGIVPVIRATTPQQAIRAVEAILAGGIPIVEITMTVPDAITAIRSVVQHYGESVLVGAGTVLTSDQANACLDAGAEFLVSPGLTPAVMDCAHSRGKLSIPGALTPSEIMQAVAYGADLIKIFPCGNVGGPKYLKALRGPFPKISLIPTGGVNASNAAEYLKAGAFALGAGADLVDATALREGNLGVVTAAARELVDIVVSTRAQAEQLSAKS
jgi:2-dehydro-3-deoxyphosphogluconate aldolase/(4S)-4-hydroxy-2-oxoglutarate aldolase